MARLRTIIPTFAAVLVVGTGVYVAVPAPAPMPADPDILPEAMGGCRNIAPMGPGGAVGAIRQSWSRWTNGPDWPEPDTRKERFFKNSSS